MRKPKIAIVTSKGGHLYQMYRLKPWWNKYDRFWITFTGADTESLLTGERIYFGYYPESRNMINALRHLTLAWRILRRERPTVLISCGAGIAPPFFFIAKLLHIRTIFIEVFDLVKNPSLTGRFVSRISDYVLIQHKSQRPFYPKAIYKGAIL